MLDTSPGQANRDTPPKARSAVTNDTPARPGAEDPESIEERITRLEGRAEALMVQLQELDDEAPPLGACDGNCSFLGARWEGDRVQFFHDQLLRWLNGNDGSSGVLRLVEHLEDVETCDLDGPCLSWVDLPQFAAEHRFDRQRDAADLASHLARYFRCVRERRRLEERWAMFRSVFHAVEEQDHRVTEGLDLVPG